MSPLEFEFHPPELVDLANWAAVAVLVHQAGLLQSSPMNIRKT